jgi:hypothetical protein
VQKLENIFILGRVTLQLAGFDSSLELASLLPSGRKDIGSP